MAAYSDNLEFNSEELTELIGILEGVKDAIQTSKTKYVDYVEVQLSPNWTTDAGQQTVNELLNFAETDIQGFITYLDQRVSDLEEAKNRTIQIDQA